MSNCEHQWIKVAERFVVWDDKESLWRDSEKGDIGKWFDDELKTSTAFTVICPNCETLKEFVPKSPNQPPLEQGTKDE